MSGDLSWRRHERYIQDVRAGDAIPPLVRTPTTRQLVMYAGASGDFYEIHYDQEFAIAHGLPGVIVHGALKNAFLATLVTEWMGRGGRLLSMSVRYRGMDRPGETLVCHGRVTAVDAATRAVRCTLWIEKATGEKTTTGEAVVELPASGPTTGG